MRLIKEYSLNWRMLSRLSYRFVIEIINALCSEYIKMILISIANIFCFHVLFPSSRNKRYHLNIHQFKIRTFVRDQKY